MNNFTKKINLYIFIIDIIIINVVFLFVFFVLNRNSLFSNGETKIASLIIYNIAFLLINALNRDTIISRKIKIEKVVKDSMVILSLFYLLFYFLYKFIIRESQINIPQHFEVFSLDFFIIILYRIYVRYKLRKLRKKNKSYSNIILLGNSNTIYEINNYLKSSIGYTVNGYFADEPLKKDIEDLKFLGTLNDTNAYLKANKIDEVYSCTHSDKGEKIKPIVAYCENNFIKFYFVPSIRNFLHRKMSLLVMDGIPILSLYEVPLNDINNKVFKRAFDILFSLFIMFFVMSWLTPIVAILIKLTSKGPVFFKQRRTGIDGKVFICYKFRSMRVNKQADSLQATINDPRKTKIGQLLRKTNIDEMPQFYNVLKGTMSVVGPRPHMLAHTQQYRKLIESFMLRQYVKPGITGYAQTTGCRGETKQLCDMEKRVEKDIWYIENWSFLLDIKIILMTIRSIFVGDEGAF